MKKISLYVLLIITSGIILSSHRNKNMTCVQNDYKICKIDSIKNWYIVYANRNDSIFKIVSMKNTENKCDCIISIGKRYDLLLQKRLENVLSSQGLKLIPMNYFDVQNLHYDTSADVFVEQEEDVFGLYTCSNLAGLCYIYTSGGSIPMKRFVNTRK